MSEWLKTSETLEHWSQNFRAMEANVEENMIVTDETIKVEKDRLDISKAYKTPKKEQVEQMFTKMNPIKFEPILRENN